MLSEKAHLEILNKFELLKDTILKGKNSITNLEADNIVSEFHHLHSLQRGIYKPAATNYVLSCKITDETNNYGTQIAWLDDTKTNFLSIKMAPPSKEKDVQKGLDIAALRHNLEFGLPLGILYKIKKGEYLCLGLGIITEEDINGNFIIKSFNFSEVKKTLNLSNEISIPEFTESITTVKSRRGQNKFREALINIKNCCEICGVSSIHTRASHIKPWASAGNSERLDPNNGLLLCPNHDHLFDKGYISFSNTGKIIFSSNLNTDDINSFGLTNEITLDIDNNKVHYLKFHRDHVFKK